MIQRSGCRHLQRLTHNKAFECLLTNWYSIIYLRKGPKNKDKEREKQQKQHEQKKQRTLLNILSRHTKL
jgi:hypothetical protein